MGYFGVLAHATLMTTYYVDAPSSTHQRHAVIVESRSRASQQKSRHKPNQRRDADSLQWLVANALFGDSEEFVAERRDPRSHRFARRLRGNFACIIERSMRRRSSGLGAATRTRGRSPRIGGDVGCGFADVVGGRARFIGDIFAARAQRFADVAQRLLLFVECVVAFGHRVLSLRKIHANAAAIYLR
jgi:hypothetical protein